ncbi:MAG: DeoR/GlpR family DNA-binding transcription regulator [Acidimicrobiales bacterium]
MTSRTADDTPPLFQTERQHEIARMIAELGRVEVAELATRFGVTSETIRRDLSELQEQRLVRRVHGGAVVFDTAGFEPLLSVREELNTTEKRRIAHRAIEELPPTGTIIIDSGSTLTRFAEVIPRQQNLRIVTNSIHTVLALADGEWSEIVVLGGRLRINTLAMVDTQTVDQVEQLVADTLFISCDGLSADRGLTTPYREEAALKQAMIRSARRVVVLADHTKFGQDHYARFAEWSDVDLLITNTEADAATLAEIETRGPEIALT